MTTEVKTNSATAAPSPAATQTSPTPSPSPQVSAETLADVVESPDSERPSWVTEDVKKAMDFDPFTPAGDETQVPAADGTQPPAEGAPAQPVSQQTVQPPSGTPPATAAAPQISPEVQAILEQNRQLVEKLAQVHGQKPGQTQGTQPQPEADQDPFATTPEYLYELPDALMVSLNSEDPGERKKAMTHLIRGVAQGIHQTVVKAVSTRLTQLQREIPQSVTQKLQYQQQASAVQQDFYGKYPQLNNPAIQPMVKQIAEQHMKATGQETWTPKLRDEIGAKAIQMLASVLNTNPPPAAPASNQAPAMFGGNATAARPSLKTGPKTQQDHMADIF